MEFTVIDKTTGKEPDLEKIARTEEWAKGLLYCDMDGFAITECGDLILLDMCGNYADASPERFEVRFAERTCTFSKCFDDDEQMPTCSACGYEADSDEILYAPGGEIVYGYDWCVGCGTKVVTR